MLRRSGLRGTISATGLLVLVGFTPLVAECFADELQTLRGDLGNLSSARSVEVRDAAGRAVLGGQFVVGSRRDDDSERIAALKATRTDATGTGDEATGQGKGTGRNGSPRGTIEVETTRGFFGFGATTQKVELSVRGLSSGSSYTLFIDGKRIASFDVNSRGRAEITWEGAVPR